jgi:hypothetical protein
MSPLSKGKAVSSLRALGRKVPLRALAQVQPVVLLQTLIGFSQTLNGSAAQLERLARALIMDGEQRLRRLRDAAPSWRLSLGQFLERVRSKDDHTERLSEEESAVQAMLQLLLGLMLEWLSKRSSCSHSAVPSIGSKLFVLFDPLFPPWRFPLLLPPRIRACPIFQTL